MTDGDPWRPIYGTPAGPWDPTRDIDTSSLLDMAFGALIMDDVNFLGAMTHTCGKNWHNFMLASGLACNPWYFCDHTSFRVFVDIITCHNPNISRGYEHIICSSSLVTFSAFLKKLDLAELFSRILWRCDL